MAFSWGLHLDFKEIKKNEPTEYHPYGSSSGRDFQQSFANPLLTGWFFLQGTWIEQTTTRINLIWNTGHRPRKSALGRSFGVCAGSTTIQHRLMLTTAIQFLHVFATCSVSDPSFITSWLTTSHGQSFCGVSHSGLIPTHSTSMYILYTDYVDAGVWQSTLKARLTKGGPVANRDGNCQTEYN